MTKKYDLTKKSDMLKFEHDIEKEVLSMAKQSIQEDFPFDIECPKCGQKIVAYAGKNICPHCQEEIELNLEF